MAVALYARVSTAKQAEKDLSIPDQLRQMREWCKGQGIAVAVEYIEPGASATDDRRPVFQQMIQEATQKPSPFDAIIVHSLSRFFRDSLEFGLYERKLDRAGVRLISITQQTSDDPSGAMVRKILSVFDEYQSKENGKHTLRAMKENARQGFFNGSKPPYGYRVVETEAIGSKGGRKKRLAIDPAEAAVVRRIYQLYLRPHEGVPNGAKGIAFHLNERGTTLRGARWTRGRVHEVLSNSTYIGEYVFNRRASKQGVVKPKSEWVTIKIDPIIDAATFDEVRARRESRAPAVAPPRVVQSPTLLTGKLKCGCCGAGMTLATGKGGRYRYYKCNTRIGQGISYCNGRSVPMDKLDNLVLQSLADKVFTPDRVRAMLRKLQQRQKTARGKQDDTLQTLNQELEKLKQRSTRLFEAVESGILPLDASLQERAQKHQARRQEILTEMAGLRRQRELPTVLLTPSKVQAFTHSLRTRLLGNRAFAKEYLRMLVDVIRLDGDTVRITGSYAALAGAALEENLGTHNGVPRFVRNWLPDLGSNQGPAD